MSILPQVFTRSNGEIPEKEREPDATEMMDVDVGEESVKRTIQLLQETSAPGPDEIPNKLLKETVNEISRPLLILFRKSLEEGGIPDDWRERVKNRTGQLQTSQPHKRNRQINGKNCQRGYREASGKKWVDPIITAWIPAG